MDIKVISLYTEDDPEWREVGEYAAWHNERYCKKYGYRWVLEKNRLSDRPVSWSKIPLFERELKDCDYCVWIDGDGIIRNRPLRRFFRSEMSITKNSDGLSATIVVMRNSDYCRRYLKIIWDQVQFLNHGWWEQMAIIWLYKTDPVFRSNMKTFDMDTFSHHIGGKTPREKLQYLRQFFRGDVGMI